MLIAMKIRLLTTSFALALLFAACGGGAGSGGAGPSQAGQQTAASGTPAQEAASGTPAQPSLSPADQELARLQAIVPATPIASAPSGVSKAGFKVTLSCATPEAKIVYTVDGGEPKPGKSAEYSGPIAVAASTLLKVRSYVPQGKASAVATIDYTIGEVCVAGGGKGAGTRSAPLGSLAAGVELAAKLGIDLVKVGPGQTAGPVELKAPVRVSGAWAAGFAKKSGKRSLLVGSEIASKDKKNPGYALKISGAAATAALKIEGMEIQGGESSFAAGLLVADGAAPTLSDCLFMGGDGSYGYGAAVVNKAAPLFVSCSFDGGPSPQSTGLSLDSAQATLHGCVAFAGNGTITSVGANLLDSKIAAYSSVFAGNAANTGSGASLYNSTGSVFESCTFWGGSGREATALYVSVGNPVVSSCLIASGGAQVSYGYYHNFGASAPAALRNCVFSGCAGGVYFHADTQTGFAQIGADGKFAKGAKVLPQPTAVACLVEAVALGPVPNCRTPAEISDAVKSGGLPNQAYGLDAGGAKRGAAWTIGAWQR